MRYTTLLLSGLLVLSLSACGGRDTSPEALHGIKISEESKTAVQQMSSKAYDFLTQVLGPINFNTSLANVLNRIGTPARDMRLQDGGSIRAWTISFGEDKKDDVRIFFDTGGKAMRVELDGGEDYFYGQDLRDLSAKEEKDIVDLQESIKLK